MNTHEELLAELRQDPEYCKIERRRRFIYTVELWWYKLLATVRDFCWSAWLSLPTEDVEL